MVARRTSRHAGSPFSSPAWARRAHGVGLTTLAALMLAVPLQVSADAAAPADFAVTDDGPLTRHDGGTDPAIAECSNSASDPAADDVLTDDDVDSNDGGNRRDGNEPTVAVDPTNPDVVVAGWNDGCSTDLLPDRPGWMGLAFSVDGGVTWADSLLPGYPDDDSTEGSLSPLKGRANAGDPVAAFDNDGRLFVGGISFNFTDQTRGDVFVSTYGAVPGPSGSTGQLPKDYLRTVRVGQKGTPALTGLFQDKPVVEVDRSTASAHEDNVYFCWSRFTGGARSHIFLARSTDHGVSFSRGAILQRGRIVGCDIAVEHDGDVYVSWTTFSGRGARRVDGMEVARSSDGGKTFGKPRRITTFTPYVPTVGGAVIDCGDGEFFCGPEGFVFHRSDGVYRLTADHTGSVPGVFATWNAVDPATVVPSTSSYSSAGLGSVGRSLVYVAKSLNNGATWSAGRPVDPSPADPGHQYFPDVDAHGGKLIAVWQDNRTDDAYDVQLPIGNRLDAQGRAVATGPDAVATYAATSTDGVTWAPLGQVSAVTHQSQYEMFGDHDLPFQGDYNWATIADGNGAAPGGLFAQLVWTDNRNVVPGVDPREVAAEGGFVDGFDVLQCRTSLGQPNTCENAGGLDQDIYGTRVPLS